MKIRTALIAAIALPFAATAQTPQPTTPATAAAIARAEALLAAAAADQPGCAIRITENGRTLIDRAFGMADLEHDIPNTTATIFEAGSVSKQFTAAAVLLLEKDGKLKLSDDIRTYLPEMPAYEAPITVEMLLNHTSGLRDWGSVAAASGKPRGERNFSNAEVLDIAARQKALNYKPGAEYSYTNTGYNLAAEIVARVSGKSFMDFTRERLFEPLGMTSSQWRDNHNRIVKNRAMAYEPAFTSHLQSMPFMDVYGNGGLLTTVADLTTWNDAMMADRLGIRAAMEHKGRLNDGREIPYARGVTVQPYNGVPEVSHSGSTGGYNSWLARYPDGKMSIAMLCNGQASGFTGIRPLTDVFLPPIPAPASTKKFPDPAPYAGRFVNTSTGFPLDFVAPGGNLQIGARILPRLSAASWRRGADTLTFSGPDKLHIEASDGNCFDYVRMPSVTVSDGQLKEYAGVYVSEETGATYRATITDIGFFEIHIDRWPDTVFRITPIYKDAFSYAGAVLFRFHRDPQGRITEMSIGDNRMRDLRIPRVQ